VVRFGGYGDSVWGLRWFVSAVGDPDWCKGLGFGVWGLGFGVWGLGFGIRGSGVWVLGFGIGV